MKLSNPKSDMVTKKYYAHSDQDADSSDWQPLSEHLLQVGQLAGERALAFKAQDWGQMAGLLHDLGKYSEAFQARLSGSKQRADHATAGAKVVVQHFLKIYGDKPGVKAVAKILAFAIAGHHAGLANGVAPGHERSTLKQRLALEFGAGIPALDDTAWQAQVVLPKNLQLPPLLVNRKPEKYKNFRQAFFTRMLFSCLIDADRIDTENYTRRIKNKPPLKSDFPAISALQAKLSAYLVQLSGNAHSSPVNTLRNDILTHARKQACLPPRLFSLTVPTGGGKTLTSLAFALDHAALQQMRRIIYVIPFTSIIEQTARVFREALGEHSGAVIEHHSAFDRDKLPDELAHVSPKRMADYKDKLHLDMASWEAPIVVTTAVQFFESLFSDRPSHCRKLHNIAGSVIVLDEAQTLPLRLLRPIMASIEELALNYGCSVVLCTATQPALLQSDNFHNGFENVREIAPNPPALYGKLRRTQVKNLGEQSDEQLKSHLCRHPQVLMIVNNRRHARELFESIATEEGGYHLTTAMCAEHRSKKLDEIRKRLQTGLPCRLVATSLIEAGVDVDFPTVYRAEAGLDSIAQAAGRCNREGRRALEDSSVFVFQSPEWKTSPELAQLAAPMRSILRLHEGDVLAPDALKRYFSQVYHDRGDELDKHKILESIGNTEDYDFSFQTIASQFRMIDSHMLPIIVPYNEEARSQLELLRHLPEHMSVGKIAQKLQRYAVQVPERAFIQLLKIGAVAAINPAKFGGQFYELTLKDAFYSEQAGLDWGAPVFQDVEKYIF